MVCYYFVKSKLCVMLFAADKENSDIHNRYVDTAVVNCYKCTKHQFIHLLTATCND